MDIDLDFVRRPAKGQPRDPVASLHKRLYGESNELQHPGHVFYALVCRVATGLIVRTQVREASTAFQRHPTPSIAFSQRPHRARTQTKAAVGDKCTSMDTQKPIFPLTKRELAQLANTVPPVHYTTLVVEFGPTVKRFREFVTFHSEYVYPEYVIAYQRFNDNKRAA